MCSNFQSYIAGLLLLSDRVTELDAAEKKGRAEGRAEGEIQRAKKVALKMLNDGLSPEQVAKYTDLTPEQIQSLNNNKVCEPTAEYNSKKPKQKRK
jgi:predicted transposase/invertase (TIGR01784 family)